MTFRFILASKSRIYAVSIDPAIVVRELTLDTPGLESLELKNLVDCNELLLCRKRVGAVVWNPWLGQSTGIEPSLEHSRLKFEGIGYDNKSYKIVASSHRNEDYTKRLLIIYDFASDLWIDEESKPEICGGSQRKTRKRVCIESIVLLNGTLYGVSYYDLTVPLYHLRKLDFSNIKFSRFCDLPGESKHRKGDVLGLRVFKGDRFSLLKQCMVTKKIQIWVTENKINHKDGDGVVWMNFMTLSSPNLPDLVDTISYSQPSYYIEDKRLVVCSCDNTGRAWIYVLGENNLISKTRLDYVVDPWPFNCAFIPSLLPVPRRGRREDRAELQVLGFITFWLLVWLQRKLKLI